MGLDGWKLDGTDPYLLEFPDAQGHHGHVSYRDYADLYYGDFFNYTKEIRGDGLVWARPVDTLITQDPYRFIYF